MTQRRKPGFRTIAAQAQDDGRHALAQARRKLCTLLFWRVCGEAQCRRARGCAGDANACFERFWRHVPKEFKTMLHAALKARAGGMSVADATRAAEDDLARYRDSEARKAEAAAGAAPAETPREPHMPRIRVL